MRDLVMHNNDNVMGSDGNYETTDTCAGKMHRLFFAEFGAWPGGRGLKFGRHYRKRQKWSDADKVAWISDAEECFQPLVLSGEIKDLSVVNVASTRRDSPCFRISAVEVRTNEKISFETDPTPWGN